ncbi:hypothetical protein FE257_009233 [Aspergillus nanangensis]|uniref:Histone acetyltransferase n=1 Tax=Aspergillus nanangensis TaxID=2582783 RepID=A0AAD4CKR8_ASPNN|nr:hypothetical protein FE257_009233 [Aspergillus nanangensis]
MPASVAAAHDDTEMRPPPDAVDSDQDAEGEEETDLYQMDQQLQDAVHRAYSGEVAEEAAKASHSEDADAEGEPDTDLMVDGANDETEPVGAVKIPDEAPSLDNDDAASEMADPDGDPAFENQSDSEREASRSRSSSHDSDDEWEGESNGREDVEADNHTVRGNCIFCGQDEDNDPSEEYEEYLTCAVCGDHSHRQCAREQNALTEIDDANPWRCPTCVREKLEPGLESASASARKIAQKNMQKELLPAHTGDENSGFHSIFNTIDPDGDLLGSSRSLRKRKTLSADIQEQHTPVLRKRQRQTPQHSDGAVSREQMLDPTDPLSPVRTRSRRTRPVEKELCRVVLRQFGRLVLAFRLNETKMSRILNSRSRSLQTRNNNNNSHNPKKTPKTTPAVAHAAPVHFAPITPASYSSPLYSLHDRETDESKGKPYGGILSEADADTSKTLPTHHDREKFEIARQKAEEEWQRRVMEAESGGEPVQHATEKVSGPPSRIKYINFGGYEIETWYAAPYPEEYSRNRVLYICEFCLKYMNSDYVAWRHKLKCPAKNPPGDEIYREDSISIFEVDGRKNPVYCQNLCLLAKLFLGSKTLYYDVEPFLFYVMTEFDDLGCHFVGYFSKEKRPSSANNVSCILTLPIHQRKGYGNLLIDFSYLLTRIEGKTGSPEKPLSDMGLVSYRNYWRLILSYQLRDQKAPLSIADLAERTGMTADDIVSGLEALRALVRDPVTKTYALRLDHKYFEECIQSWESKGYVHLNPDALVWTPYIMGRSNQSQFDRAPLHAVAPREGLEDENAEEEKESSNEEDQDATEPKPNGRPHPIVNGTGHADSEGFTSEAAGPPSTSFLSNVNGFRHQTTARAESDAPIEPNPAGDIPAWRFEIYPPVQAPVFKRKPGRPFGSKSAHNKIASTPTPTTARTSGRNTPRRSSILASVTPTANLPSIRRGRSAKLMDSPAMEPTGVQSNGVNDDPFQTLEDTTMIEAEQAPDPESLALPESKVNSSTVQNNVTLDKPNGNVHSAVGEGNDVTRAPAEPLTPTKRSGADNAAKLSKSVSRNSVVEKLSVLFSAGDDNGVSDGQPGVNGTDADGDAVMET